MTSKAPIPAFCSSDEEDEDKEALLYLPIAPEIEDPEDNWVPVSVTLSEIHVEYHYFYFVSAIGKIGILFPE